MTKFIDVERQYEGLHTITPSIAKYSGFKKKEKGKAPSGQQT